MMSISKYVNRNVCSLSEDASLSEAVTLMKDKNVGSIVIVKSVTSDPTPVGVLTDRDIVIKLLADEVNLKIISVKDTLTSTVCAIKEQEGMDETIELMCDNAVRRIPIVNEQGQLTGIVTLDDLIVALANKMHHLSELIEKQMN
jgi:CBS domain-containing protein